MKTKHVIHSLLYIGAIGISIISLFFIITCSWIGYEVKQQCKDAKEQYLSQDGDCVTALIHLLNDEGKGFKARNSAIWALGQLGDARALPVLQSYYTGNIPPREPLSKTISQYELKKAIQLTNGGLNISAIIWRTMNF